MTATTTDSGFDYDVAFSRNIGWVTEAEQQRLRSCRVAVGGLGGVGGSHLLTLARLGIGAFTITDLDTFDTASAVASVRGRVTVTSQRKIDTAIELMESHVDVADMVARLAGDEFTIILPALRQPELELPALCERAGVELLLRVESREGRFNPAEIGLRLSTELGTKFGQIKECG